MSGYASFARFYDALTANVDYPARAALYDKLLRRHAARPLRLVLDLCCGSGCIGITLSRLGGLEVTAVDREQVCIDLTRENARINGVQVEALRGDLFGPVQGRRFDMIVSNPPYLTGEDMRQLQPELTYEPESALYGGPDGLAFYRAIAQVYKTYLAPGGALLLEVGAGQAKDVSALLEDAWELHEDINGIQRVVCAWAQDNS